MLRAMIYVLLWVATTQCLAIQRSLDPHHPLLAGQCYEYVYRIDGLRSLPGDVLRLRVHLSYDGMPVLHVDRVAFEHQGRVLAIADPYFLWVQGEPGKSPVTISDDTDLSMTQLWHSIESLDGSELRALFEGYEAPGYSSLSEFDELPVTESTSLDVVLEEVVRK
jgi:hypothetical protein